MVIYVCAELQHLRTSDKICFSIVWIGHNSQSWSSFNHKRASISNFLVEPGMLLCYTFTSRGHEHPIRVIINQVKYIAYTTLRLEILNKKSSRKKRVLGFTQLYWSLCVNIHAHFKCKPKWTQAQPNLETPMSCKGCLNIFTFTKKIWTIAHPVKKIQSPRREKHR